MRLTGWIGIGIGALLFAGCAPPEHLVVFDLFVAGPSAGLARAEVELVSDRPSARGLRRQRAGQRLPAGGALTDGVRVATFDAVPDGRALATLDLYDDSGARVATSALVVDVRGSRAFRFRLEQGCERVICARDETCHDGACGPLEQAPPERAPPSRRTDAGAREVAIEADAGPSPRTDAGAPDAGTPDAGPAVSQPIGPQTPIDGDQLPSDGTDATDAGPVPDAGPPARAPGPTPRPA